MAKDNILNALDSIKDEYFEAGVEHEVVVTELTPLQMVRLMEELRLASKSDSAEYNALNLLLSGATKNVMFRGIRVRVSTHFEERVVDMSDYLKSKEEPEPEPKPET